MIDEKPESEGVSALAPFRHGIFRAVWTASLVSNFGGLIQGVGAAWMMTTIATSPYQVALVQASTTLPIMLFALVAGAIADSFDRRKVMLVAQTFMLVVSVLLTVFTWYGLITPWTLLAFTFLIDSGTALNSPSWQASVGDMVPRAKVPAAVALNSHGLQPDAQRRPGDRRHHRRGRRRRGRLRGQRRELYRPDLRAGALEAGRAGVDLAARVAGRGHGCRPALCRHVAQHRQGAGPGRRLRLQRRRRAGAACRWSRATSSRATP